MSVISKEFRKKGIHTLYNMLKFIKYNIRIIFGSRFLYFLLFAVLFFITILLIDLFDNNIPNEAGFYNILIVPAVSIILYPAAFGIQSDQDLRTLEVLFGIPDYRYKVWLIRLVLVFCISFLIVMFLAMISHLMITDIRFIKMAWQLLFPTIFCGCTTFMFSTWFKNGTGAAVLLIIIMLAFFIFGEEIEDKTWFLFLNPFLDSGSKSQLVWENVILKNRLYLGGLSVLFLLFGLYNLQKREKFLK